MLDKKIRLLKDIIQTHIDDTLLAFNIELQTMGDRNQEMEKQKQSTQEGEVE
jgi:hypothetical protein